MEVAEDEQAEQTEESMTAAGPEVAVIGGGIRGSMFARVVQQCDRARLVAIGDPSEQVRAELGARHDVPTYADVEALITAHPSLDAAIIATPDFAHRDAAVRCAEAGLALMIEKPLATTSADAEAIVAAAEQAGVSIMVGFENRWNPRFAAVRAELATGARVVNQVAHLNDTVYVPTQMLSWAAQSSPAWFLMPHTLDLTMWLSGASPVEVYARSTDGVLTARGVDTLDSVTATFGMSDGSTVQLNSQWVLPESSPAVFDFRYEVNTAEASYRFDIADAGVTRYAADGVAWLQFGVYERHGRIHGIPVDMAVDFLASLDSPSAGTGLDLPDARYGLLITRAIEAVHTSLRSGQPEVVDPGRAGTDRVSR